MRLEGQTKLGYYPTPLSQVDLIATWLQFDRGGEVKTRLLDPCAGKGEALAHLAALTDTDTETFGIELSDTRAQAAEQVLDHVINAAFEHAVLTEETFSLIFLNPPYDGETMTGGGKRLEYVFLKNATPLLVRSGVLVYIIPETRVDEDVARLLVGWYEDLRIFRFTPDEYKVFKQVVIFGKRRQAYQQPAKADVEDILHWRQGQVVVDWFLTKDEKGNRVIHRLTEPLPDLRTGQGEYRVPLSPKRGRRGRTFRFKYAPVTVEDYLRAADEAAQRLEHSHEWRDFIPQVEMKAIHPVIRPKAGHIAMQVSGGLLGTNQVADEHGRPLLIKGGLEKYWVQVEDDGTEAEAEAPDDGKPLFRVKLEERSRPILYTLDADGTLVTVRDPDRISAILRDHVEQIAERMLTRNTPRYDYDPADWEWAVMQPLSPHRYLPGRKETGLTEPQKHYAIATGRLLTALKAGIINAEMGAGKTTMSLAVAEYLRAALRRNGSRRSPYPGLVVGPGIVTGDENWPKEVREVIPGAKAVVIEAAVNPLPKPAKVIDWLREWADEYGYGLGVSKVEENALAGANAQEVFQTIERWAERDRFPLPDEVRRALWHTLKAAEANPPKRRANVKAPNLLDARVGGFLWLGTPMVRDRNHEGAVTRRYSLVRFIRDYQAGRLPERSFAVMSFETAKLGAGRVPAMPHKRILMPDKNDQRKPVVVCTCPECGQIVSREYEDGQPVLYKAVKAGKDERQYIGQKRRTCRAQVRRWVYNPETGEHEEQFVTCGAPLFQDTALRRESAARYIQRQARGFFPLLIVDEIHEAKAKGTGNGWALAALTGATSYTLGLTGTLLSGYSTSVFWLLYRIAPEVRKEFGFHQERAWVRKFGLEKRTFYVLDF